MPTRSSLTLLLMLMLIAVAATAAPPEYSDHSNLLIYKDQAGKEQPVKTPADWKISRV